MDMVVEFFTQNYVMIILCTIGVVIYSFLLRNDELQAELDASRAVAAEQDVLVLQKENEALQKVNAALRIENEILHKALQIQQVRNNNQN